MKTVLFLLLIGVFQTITAHLCGFHRDLAHMQDGNHWWLYVIESLFYSGAWSLFWLGIVSQEEKRNAEERSIKIRREERLRDENTN